MSQALRKLAGAINKSNTCAIFINQLREKVGVMFGNPEVTTGGRALKFYATMRIDVRRVEGIKQGDQFIGNRTRVKIVKNKVAPPFKQAEFDIMYGHGISREGDALDCAVEHKIVDKAGAWYSYEGNRIGQGRENVKRYLAENPEILNRIEAQIREKISPSENGEDEQLSGAQASVGSMNKNDIPDDIADQMDLIDENAPIIDPETGEILD